LDKSQPAVLKTENAADPRVSTLRRYLEAVARLKGSKFDFRIVATIGDEDIVIRLPDHGSAETDSSGNAAPSAQPGGTHPKRPAERQPTMTTEGSRWRLRAWDDERLEKAWQQRNLITMSFDEIGDMTVWPGDMEVRKRLHAALPERPERGLDITTTYWRYFRQEMAVGDLVVVPLSGRRAAVARIVGDYRYDKDEPSEFLRHQRPVDWIAALSRDDLTPGVRKVVNAPGTICRVSSPFPDQWWHS